MTLLTDQRSNHRYCSVAPKLSKFPLPRVVNHADQADFRENPSPAEPKG
jgi:hypothetical protein